MLQYCLDLSTVNLPLAEPQWGALRVAPHYHGWVVFHLAGRFTGPAWYRPIWDLAERLKSPDRSVILVSFDSDARPWPGLPTYEW